MDAADHSMPQAPDQGEDISFQALSARKSEKISYSDDQLEGKGRAEARSLDDIKAEFQRVLPIRPDPHMN